MAETKRAKIKEFEFFVKKGVHHDLRTKELCQLLSVSSQSYGLNYLSVRGSLLWNTHNEKLKLASSFEKFKKEIGSWDGSNCTCNIFT